MSTDIQVFQNPKFGAVRTTEIDGVPYLVAKDVAKILGYKNTKQAVLDHVEEEDKRDGVVIRDPIGREQAAVVINESGVYSLILSSKLSRAKEFKRWVTAEVLPSIRRHGAYMTEETLEDVLTSPGFLIRLATELKEEHERRLLAEKRIEEDRSKVVFAEAVALSGDGILVGDLAKLICQNGVDIGQNRLFSWLRENGYLMKQGSSRNMPTQKSADMGLIKIRERVIVDAKGATTRTVKTPKITGKGQRYFVNKFLLETVCEA